MATYMPSPGQFRGADADPEATLELFDDYLEKMEKVYRLSRGYNPVTGIKVDWSSEEKKDLLLVEGGNEVSDLFKYVGKVLDEDTYQQAVNKVKAALKKRGNRTSAVFKLFNSHGQGSQSFDSWHKEIRKAAKLIDWTDYDADKATVDAIVMQTSSSKLQQRAIQENPSYDEIVNLGISQEQAKKKAAKLPDGESESVNRLQTEVRQLKSKMSKNSYGKKDKTDGGSQPKTKTCEKCMFWKCKGGEKCIAKDKACNVCKKTGHFAASKICQKKKKADTTRNVQSDGSSSESEESLCRILTVAKIRKEKGESKATEKEAKHKGENIVAKIKMAAMEDNGKEVSIQPVTDTGVKKTILCKSDWNKIGRYGKVVKTDTKFRPYGTSVQLPILGKAKVYLKAQAGAVIATHVYISQNDDETSLLGKNDAERLGIVKINPRGSREEVNRIKVCRKSDLKKKKKGEKPEKEKEDVEKMDKLAAEFEDIFKGIGKYRGEPVKIQIPADIMPIIQPPRRIPLHYVQPLKDHLEEMIKEDVIEGPLSEEEEGSWISNLVITDKKWDGAQEEGRRIQIRANLDLRPLNTFIYQTHEPIPTPEELRHNLKGSTKYSSLDMIHSFHQFELEEEAKKLFCFRAPGGLFRFKRLCMGSSPASSEAHKRIKKVVAGLKGVLQIKDDVLVHGVGEEHDERLRAVLTRFQEAGLTLRREKCHLGKAEVKWFGMIFSEEGMSPDPEKTAIIRTWPAPRTVRDVKSFLQTVQFNSAYLGAEEPGEMNYAELTAPLRELTRRKTKFTWTAKHQKHFEHIRERLCSDKVMVPFDPARDTRLYSDGGPEGAQATVAQRYDHPEKGEQWRPVAHTARAWTDCEKRYSQIEKESNALLTGVTSNKTYLLGVNFEAVVDHKPLLPLYNNPKRPKQMRVDRHRMKLAGYRFHVSHISGEKNPCDYGSRAGCPVQKEHTEQEKKDKAVEDDLDVYVNRLVEDQLPTAITRKMMQLATRTDKELQKVKEDLRTGKCRNGLTRFTKVFPELTEEEGIIMRGEQIVIPRELQATVVHLAHEGHLGQDKTLGLLRETCWFPGMGDLVHKFVSTCRPCLAAVPGTQKEPLKPTLLPDGPWQRVHADYKGPIGQKYYLHTFIDQFSKYPVVEVCANTSWAKMEPQLDRVTGLLGNMDVLITDGGPPYSSHDFKKYMERKGIKHHLCAPENPMANGFVEVFQKVLAKMVHTAVAEKKDPRKVIDRYLMAYRAAPHKTTGLSPYEMMFGRKMKTNLPQNLKKKKGSDREEEARARHDRKKGQQKEAFDKKQKSKEKKLNKGDEVLVQQKKTSVRPPWDPEGYEVKEVKGSKVTLQRGDETKIRAKNNLKAVPKRTKELDMDAGFRTKRRSDVKPDLESDAGARTRRTSDAGFKTKRRDDDELDLEVAWETIQAMGDQPEAQGLRQGEEEGQEEEGRQEEGPPEDGPELQELPESEEEEEEEEGPELQELPESEEEEDEEEEEEVQGGGRGSVAKLEAVRLVDTLHLGAYWPVREGEDRRRRPPPRLGLEQERGSWEERLPRELSMGDPGSRQLTPQPSPVPSPPSSPLNQTTNDLAFEYQQLPASRDWDSNEIAAMQVDWSKPPRCNLVCIHHFCPQWAGEEEPDQMEEVLLTK